VDLGLTREQRAVSEAFAALFEKQATPQRVRAAESSPSIGFDQLLWRHYADMGALGIGVPSDCGGGDGGLLELALVAEEAGRRIAPIPVAETAAAARALGRLGEKELLGPVLTGSVIVSLATQVGPLSQQMLVDGAIADAVLALDGAAVVYVTRPDELPKTAGRNLGALPLGRWDAPGTTTVLAEGSDASTIFAAAIDEVRVLRAAALVGLASEAIGIGSRYAVVREAFGQPIGMYRRRRRGTGRSAAFGPQGLLGIGFRAGRRRRAGRDGVRIRCRNRLSGDGTQSARARGVRIHGGVRHSALLPQGQGVGGGVRRPATRAAHRRRPTVRARDDRRSIA
jgi:alkylation response protein AidB-like acyl-CoA dehydrogenase